MPADPLPGVIPSPNIWRFTDVYETENRGADPDRLIEASIVRLHPLEDATVLDLGCGSGYHLPWFARHARAVIGVEPHEPLLRLARQRLDDEPEQVRERVRLRRGTAQQLPLADASLDVVHGRWASFFGPGCEPGLAELARVVRPGGTAFVIDNDATRSTFGRWFTAGLPSYDAVAVEGFWAGQGFDRERLDIRWSMPTRADLEAVVRIEFAPTLARRLLAEHPGTDVDDAVNLWWRRYRPTRRTRPRQACAAPTPASTLCS